MAFFNKKCATVLLLGLAVVGCADRMGIAEQEMAAIRSGPANSIEPIPMPKTIEDYTYRAKEVRDPFVAQSLLSMQAVQAEQMASGVKPDTTRKRYPLEEYELSELIYRGKVVAPNGKEHGLVQLPSGSIQDIQVGDYVGKSDGRVVEITSTQINLIELIPDARVGYVEKTTSLVSPE